MVKTLTANKKHTKQNSAPVLMGTTRTYGSDEFEADTEEDRSIPVLAEKRRRFLTGLKAQSTEPEA